MDDPKHTAEWLAEQVYELQRSDEPLDLGRVALILNVLDRFQAALGRIYSTGAPASEKLTGCRSALLSAVGAEAAGGHSVDDLLGVAAIDLAVLKRQEFRSIE